MILTFFALGVLLKRIKSFPGNTSHVLNLMVIWVALPAVIFLQTPKIMPSSTILIPAIIPWIMIIFFALLTYSLRNTFAWNTKTLGALLLLVPLGNTSFLGIPMVKSFFGENAIPIALIYDQVGSFLGLGIYGVIIVSIYASGDKLVFTNVVKKAITFPPFISMVLAFIVGMYFRQSQSYYPDSLIKILDILAAMLIPMAMIAVGFQLKLKLSKKGYVALGYGLFAKLLLAPLLLLIIFKTLGWNHQIVQVTIFEAAMPPMITAGAVSISSGLDEELSASMVGLGLLISLVTLPILHGLIAS